MEIKGEIVGTERSVKFKYDRPTDGETFGDSKWRTLRRGAGGAWSYALNAAMQRIQNYADGKCGNFFVKEETIDLTTLRQSAGYLCLQVKNVEGKVVSLQSMHALHHLIGKKGLVRILREGDKLVGVFNKKGRLNLVNIYSCYAAIDDEIENRKVA